MISEKLRVAGYALIILLCLTMLSTCFVGHIIFLGVYNVFRWCDFPREPYANPMNSAGAEGHEATSATSWFNCSSHESWFVLISNKEPFLKFVDVGKILRFQIPLPDFFSGDLSSKLTATLSNPKGTEGNINLQFIDFPMLHQIGRRYPKSFPIPLGRETPYIWPLVHLTWRCIL